jgi:hypothetical protein
MRLLIGDDLVEAREAEGGVHRRESGALDEGSRVIVSAGEGGALRTRHRAHAAVDSDSVSHTESDLTPELGPELLNLQLTYISVTEHTDGG